MQTNLKTFPYTSYKAKIGKPIIETNIENKDSILTNIKKILINMKHSSAD